MKNPANSLSAYFKGPARQKALDLLKNLRLFASGKNLLLAALFIICLTVNLLFFSYPLEKIQGALKKTVWAKAPKWLNLHGTSTLSLMDAYFLGGEKRIRKTQKGRRIYLEIYDSSENSLSWIDSIQLKGRYNGYFEYSGKHMGQHFNETISLGILDQEGDGQLEIVAPAFDKFFMPHVNLVFYNSLKKKFELRRSLEKPSID